MFTRNGQRKRLNKRENEKDCAKLQNSSTYISVVLLQDLIVLAKRSQEDERRHILEAVDPFPPL